MTQASSGDNSLTFLFLKLSVSTVIDKTQVKTSRVAENRRISWQINSSSQYFNVHSLSHKKQSNRKRNYILLSDTLFLQRMKEGCAKWKWCKCNRDSSVKSQGNCITRIVQVMMKSHEREQLIGWCQEVCRDNSGSVLSGKTDTQVMSDGNSLPRLPSMWGRKSVEEKGINTQIEWRKIMSLIKAMWPTQVVKWRSVCVPRKQISCPFLWTDWWFSLDIEGNDIEAERSTQSMTRDEKEKRSSLIDSLRKKERKSELYIDTGNIIRNNVQEMTMIEKNVLYKRET